MRSVSPAEGSEASTFTVPNLGRHPYHQRVKLHVGAAKQDGWTRRWPPPQSLRDSSPSGGAISDRWGSDSADHSMWSAGADAEGGGGELAVSRSCAVASPSVAARQLPLRGSDFRPMGIGFRRPLNVVSGGRCRRQRGRAGGQPELRGGLPLSRCATAPPQGERFPTDGDRIPPTTQCGQRGQMPKAEGESWRSAGVARWPPPQSLRDSSPSGGAISDRWGSDSADHSMWSAGVARWPPPQSLRDSSPSGGAISDRWESDSADHSMWSAGVARWPPPQFATASPRGERFPIPLSPAEGESVAVSGGLRGAPAHRS